MSFKEPPHFATTLQQFTSSTMYLVQELGPTQFIIQESNENFRVSIGQYQECSCKSSTFPCIHTLFVMIKIFKLNSDSPYLFQQQLNDYDIDRIVSWSTVLKQQQQKQQQQRSSATLKTTKRKKPVEQDSICVICFDSLFENKSHELCHCYECGNNLHCNCMRIWMEHSMKQKNTLQPVNCPYCRHTWTEELHQLNRQKKQQSNSNNKKQQQQILIPCCHCNQSIKSLEYKCNTCVEYYLCEQCFKNGEHLFHQCLQFSKQEKKWIFVKRKCDSLFQIQGTSFSNYFD